jgi:FemAB-related protein (PEP-CTERM system-associated)
LAVRIYSPDRPPSALEHEAWDAFVANQPYGHLFHTLRWQGILQKTFHDKAWHLAAMDGEEIRGILSLQAVRGLFGKLNLYSPSYTAYGGLLAADDQAAQALADATLDLCRQNGAGMANLRNYAPNGLSLPTTDLHASFVKDLASDEKGCLESIPRKSRWTVRQAITKHELTFEVNRDVDLMWELHAVNLRKLGSPVFPKPYFQAIMDELGDQADILFVKYKGKAIAGVMNFYYRDLCNPYFSGGLPQYNFTGANNYMYYALMTHAITRGCRRFDFGKSRQGTGPCNFKVNMGFTPRTLPYQFVFNTEQHIPNLNPSNPKLALFINLWSRQPLWTSKLLGPWFNRRLP